MGRDIKALWTVVVAVARFGPTGRGTTCASIRTTRTGRVMLWLLWAFLAWVTMAPIHAQRRGVLTAAGANVRFRGKHRIRHFPV